MTTDRSGATSWDDLKGDLAFTPEEEAKIEAGTQQMLAEVRAYRLAEVRKRQHITQNQVAKILGVTQGRVSAIERGEVRRSEVETLASYVAALGGQLKLVADFGDESLVLG
ncbi:XRE family transcriptional regulator [Streptomyces sp. NPDC056549]|uniref:XRE family transcriptional regulator n=1 Tax=Streptomyces sp. NPDC056549 TaxID=3345864 RepID=UPI0036B0CC9A